MHRLDETSARYGMAIKAEKAKMMTNRNSTFRLRISSNGQELETVQISGGHHQCRGIQDRNPDGETEANLERQEHRAEVQNEALTC